MNDNKNDNQNKGEDQPVFPIKHQTKGDYLAQALGRKPADLDQLTNYGKGHWPEEQDFDEFMEALRLIRKCP